MLLYISISLSFVLIIVLCYAVENLQNRVTKLEGKSND